MENEMGLMDLFKRQKSAEENLDSGNREGVSMATSPMEAGKKGINPEAYPSVCYMLEAAMATFADKPAFEAFGQTLTYADMDRLSSQLGAYLQHEAGVRKGDRVAVMTPNIFAFPIMFLALVRIGAVQVSVNPLYSAGELKHQINDAGATTVLVYTGATETLAQIRDETGLKTVITAGLGSGGTTELPSPPISDALGQHITFEDALQTGASLERKSVDIALSDILFLQYTGGTTGLSKGAVLTHRNLVANTEQFKAGVAEVTQVGDETIVTALPLYHIFALMVNFITYFTLGARNILIANPRDMDGFTEAIMSAELTAITGVNTLYAGLMAHPNFEKIDWSRLRLAMGGGAPVFKSTSEAWCAVTGLHIIEGYGLSETSPVLTMNDPMMTEFTETVGKPAPSTEVILLGDDDEIVAHGERGEVCAKGPQVTSGYWNREDLHNEIFTTDGYFRTGDIGIWDEHGDLKIVDRKKDMILVSGFNVFPNEIESVVSQISGVIESACIGIPDAKTGEAVKLFLVVSPETGLDAERVRAHCREKLAAYKVPKHIEFMDDLPKSAVGKIMRRKLRD